VGRRRAILDTDLTFAPLWLAEGLASLYEAPVFTADGGIRGEPKNRRQDRMLARLASPPVARARPPVESPRQVTSVRCSTVTTSSRPAKPLAYQLPVLLVHLALLDRRQSLPARRDHPLQITDLVVRLRLLPVHLGSSEQRLE
jgi:hypothetical protein